jgi:hypothetical protein
MEKRVENFVGLSYEHAAGAWHAEITSLNSSRSLFLNLLQRDCGFAQHCLSKHHELHVTP